MHNKIIQSTYKGIRSRNKQISGREKLIHEIAILPLDLFTDFETSLANTWLNCFPTIILCRVAKSSSPTQWLERNSLLKKGSEYFAAMEN